MFHVVERLANGSPRRWVELRQLIEATRAGAGTRPAESERETTRSIRREVLRELTVMADHGVLTHRTLHPAGGVTVVTATARGATMWREWYAARGGDPPTPTSPPHTAGLIHHLLTVAGTIEFLSKIKGRFSQLHSDEDLRRASRIGRRLARGQRDQPVADARLLFKRRSQETNGLVDDWRYLETITSRYSTQQLDEKFARLDLSRYELIVTSEQVAERVRAHTDRPLHLLTGPSEEDV